MLCFQLGSISVNVSSPADLNQEPITSLAPVKNKGSIVIYF